MNNRHCIICGVKVSKNSRARCRSCENERRRIETPVGKNHFMWRGENVSINGKHRWIERRYGKPQECEKCGTKTAKRYDWANISQTYRRDRLDYKRLCRSCHLKYDRRTRDWDKTSWKKRKRNERGQFV